MDYFCLIYPDAVFNGIANRIVEQLVKVGIKLEDRVVRKLSFEEAKTIFYARRHNSDFNAFCQAMSSSSVWLLHLRTNQPIANILGRVIHPSLLSEFFIPEKEEDNFAFTRMITSSTESKKELNNIIQGLRERTNLQEQSDDYVFTSFALKQGQRLYSYYIAMMVSGFEESQAFNLTLNAQMFFNDRELEGMLPDDDDDEVPDIPDDDDDLTEGEDLSDVDDD